MGILDTVDPSCVIGLVLMVVFLAGVAVWLSTDRDQVTTTESEPVKSDGSPQTPQTIQTANEPPTLNTWSAIHTGQHIYALPASSTANLPLTPDEAEHFISLLEAADHDDPPRPMPRTHCPLCIYETCDQWGIPLDQARTIGAPRYCHLHTFAILAHARQGA